MPSKSADENTKARSPRRRRVAAGGLALGIASLLSAGTWAPPAYAQTPTTVLNCSGSSAPFQFTAYFSGFPSNQTFKLFAFSETVLVDNWPISIDSAGNGDLSGGVSLSHASSHVRYRRLPRHQWRRPVESR